MTDKKELVLTARTTFVIEMDHRNNWDTESKASQIFDSGDRENTQVLENLIYTYARGNIRILSHNTSVVVLRKS